MKNKPLVSVLVHTKNSQRTIQKHLESIQNQTYKNIEIIVVDNNSTDKTREMAKKFTKSIYIFGPERSAQRNFGAKKAKGDYLLIPDSDMTLHKDVVKECVELLEKFPKVKAVVIPEKSIGKGFWSKCKALERECYFGDETIEAARFFEKNAYWEMGGYDEQITGPEDWDLPLRMKEKFKIGRINSFISHDEGSLSLLGLMKKKYYYAQKISYYLRKHPIATTKEQILYLLRPAFYRNWKRLIKNPLLTCGMIIMLSAEQIAGLGGFVRGEIAKFSTRDI